MFHFKDILQTFEKINPSKNGEEDRYFVLKNFINVIEKILPEEEIIKLNNNSSLLNNLKATCRLPEGNPLFAWT